MLSWRLMTVWKSSSTPRPEVKTVGTIGTPKRRESCFTLNASPRSSASSYILSAQTMGMCMSISWVVR